jgi:hypothetical protein
MGFDQLGCETRDGGELFTVLDCTKKGWGWWRSQALVNVIGIFGSRRCGIDIGGYCGGVCCGWWHRTRCLVTAAIGDWDHSQAGPGALVATDDDAVTVGDGTVDLGEGDHAASIAHGYNGEEGVRC